jgi:hypothetical protein
MAPLLLTCPVTGGRVPTGIENEAASLQSSWFRRIEINCPLCRGTHASDVREIYCDSTLQDPSASAFGRKP